MTTGCERVMSIYGATLVPFYKYETELKPKPRVNCYNHFNWQTHKYHWFNVALDKLLRQIRHFKLSKGMSYIYVVIALKNTANQRYFQSPGKGSQDRAFHHLL